MTDDQMIWGIWEDRRGPIWGRFHKDARTEALSFKNFKRHEKYHEAVNDFMIRQRRFGKTGAGEPR